jgi:hypothetical protein
MKGKRKRKRKRNGSAVKVSGFWNQAEADGTDGMKGMQETRTGITEMGKALTISGGT